MNLVNLNFYAEGYYSGQTYEENILITEDFYNKIKDKIEGMEVYVYDIDGDNSEVLGDIDVQFCKEKDIEDWYQILKNDGYIFWEHLEEVCQDLGLDLVENKKIAIEYAESFDCKVEMTFNIRKSQIDKVKKFIEELENE